MMNRRDLLVSLGAAMAAGGMPAVAVELAKLPAPALIDFFSKELSVVFEYSDGTSSVRYPMSKEGGDVPFRTWCRLWVIAPCTKTGTIISVSLHADGDFVGRSNLSHQSVCFGDSMQLEWPIRVPRGDALTANTFCV
jgi:hypothetical protein